MSASNFFIRNCWLIYWFVFM